MLLVLAFISGLLFAAGLGISGMTQPEKVSAFLNIMGDWDPSLMLVLMSASSTYFIGRNIMARRDSLGHTSKKTSREKISLDKGLIGGSVLFGIGWGMVGFCPGPALVSVSTASPAAILFTTSMILGMIGYNVLAEYSIGVSPKDETIGKKKITS